MWVSVAMMAVQFIGALFSNSAQKEAAKAQRIVDEANVNAKNTVRAANNELAASSSSLANHMRSLNNNQLMKVAGQQYNALGDNMVRSLDQSTVGTIQQRLQSAEQAGALMASASSAGVGGSTLNMIEGAMALRRAQVEEVQSRQEGYAVSDATKQANSVMTNALRQLDYGTTFANIDYGQDVAPYRASPSLGEALIGATQKSLPALNNIASSFSRAPVPKDPNILFDKPLLKEESAEPTSQFFGGISNALGSISNFFKPTSSGSNFKL